MRLIDADELEKSLENSCDTDSMSRAFVEFLNYVDDAPTIDAVPVVRCRECKNCDSKIDRYNNFIGFCKIRKDSYGDKLRVGLSDYCSDGDRKEGTDNG